jgi:methionyl-tRNA formyltransferase
MAFRVGVMCLAHERIVDTFLERNAPGLRQAGVELATLVLDEDQPGQDVWRSLWRLAGRQARLLHSMRLTMLVRLLTYRELTRPRGREFPIEPPRPPFPPDLPVVRVPTLNAPAARQAIRAAQCDLVCLMGARYLVKRTLAAIGVPIVNIHSSDPRFVRGGPVVIWEILDNRPEIGLVVHQVTEVLDAGAILAQDAQPILYRHGLGPTTAATMIAARPRVADLFERVIRDAQAGTSRLTRFAPGPLKVTPRVRETLRADVLCKQRSRARRAATLPAA